MKIYAGSGVQTTGKLSINKAISGLLVKHDFHFEQSQGLEIFIEIQRANGNNEEVTKGGFQPLHKIVRLTKHNTEVSGVIDDGHDSKGIASIELTEDGGSIFLEEKETISIEVKGLNIANRLEIYGMEEPVFSNEVRSFEEKTMASDDKEKVFTVTGYDVALIDNQDGTITDVSLTFQNGKVVKYEIEELVIINMLNCAISAVTVDSVTVTNSSLLMLPLLFVDTIQIRKTQGSIVNVSLRKG